MWVRYVVHSGTDEMLMLYNGDKYGYNFMIMCDCIIAVGDDHYLYIGELYVQWSFDIDMSKMWLYICCFLLLDNWKEGV